MNLNILFWFEISKVMISVLNFMFLVESYPEISLVILAISILTSFVVIGAVSNDAYVALVAAAVALVAVAVADDFDVAVAVADAVAAAAAVALVAAAVVAHKRMKVKELEK